MRKYLSLLLVVLVLVPTFALSACEIDIPTITTPTQTKPNDPSLDNHEHSYTATVVNPTCTSQGFTTYTCECDDNYISDYVDALGHTEVVDEAVAPTCTATGLTEGSHCSVCSEVIVEQTELPIIAHVYDNEADESCNECGYIRDTKCAHTSIETIKGSDATCTAAGLTEGTKCAGCSEILVAQQEIPALGHTEVVDSAISPTCTTTGLTAGSHCSVCNAVLVAQTVVAANGHTYIDGYCHCGATNEITNVTGSIDVISTGYSFETIYCEWAPLEGAESYNVYCDDVKVDAELIRSYGSYYRCDILGLSAGEYTISIIPVTGGEEIVSAKTSFNKTTINHIREGFAFVNGTSSGAYNDNGTLKSNARVLYITNENKDTITMSVKTSKSAYTECVGIQNILTALKKGYETDPVCIRVIGNITDPSTLEKGDLLIDCGKTKFTGGITLEGVGNDATFNGFGLRIKSSSNIEVRNLGFMNCDSNEGDSIGLQQDNNHIWIHNCDIFYGIAGSDADQDKGDGALDTKKSTYVTISFNHFYDTGKSNLLGNSGESEDNYLTYHHNWYDHSDSRHPRVRTCSVHVYNNFFDGVSKYGIGATEGASIFSENNYFLNTNYPMLISMQGSDIAGDNEGTFSSEDGGIIKAFGNIIVGTGHGVVTYQQNNTEFDCYLASTRDEKVPSSVTAKQGGSDYNNFDTDSSIMYNYNVQTAEQAMETVKAYAGRVQGGDFKWTFTDEENSSYAVNTELKAALVAYKGTLVSTNVGDTITDNNSGSDDGGSDDSGSDDNGSEVTPTPEGAIVHNFHESGKNSDFFTISGNLSTSKGTITYNGLSLTQCLKMESSTSITFTLTEARTLTLVFGTASKTVKVDGTKYTTDSNCIVTVELEAGSHTITKGDSINLYYMILE